MPGSTVGGRSRRGVARGVLRVAGLAPGARALPIPELLGGRMPELVALTPPLDGREFLLPPFSFLADGGRRRCAGPEDAGLGVGVFGRPLAPGRGVGDLRVGERPGGRLLPGAAVGDAMFSA